MSQHTSCPTCGQLLPNARGKRMCAACGKQIVRHDKWFFGGDGRPRHKDCSNPAGYPKVDAPKTMELLEAQ